MSEGNPVDGKNIDGDHVKEFLLSADMLNDGKLSLKEAMQLLGDFDVKNWYRRIVQYDDE